MKLKFNAPHIKMRLTLITTVISVIFLSTLPSTCLAQEFRRNTVSINELDLIVHRDIALTINYERYLSKRSSLGISLSNNFKSGTPRIFDHRFITVPYYRLYMGRIPGYGFFFEGFSMFDKITSKPLPRTTPYSSNPLEKKHYKRLSIGLSIGGRFNAKKNFFGEVSLGVGHIIVNTGASNQPGYREGSDTVLRVGVSIGKRF